MKIVFFATPDIALESFKYFINSCDYEVCALVTQRAKAQNRGKKIVDRNITKMARENSIRIFEPEKISKEEEIIKELEKIEPDFFITFAFGQILSQKIIDIPKYATINLHASLLPEYRGANPIAQAIIDGCTKSGITTMKTALELDAGDICLQKEIEIAPDENVIDFMEKISALSPMLLDKTLKGLKDGTITPKPQNSKNATFTKKMKKEDKIIDFNTDALALHNKIRGMFKINTNHATYKNKIIKILKTCVIEKKCNTIGQVTDILKDGIVVSCKNNAIKILTVKPEGKAVMPCSDWARGARIQVGDYFT